jgi:hypothetical protein
MGAPREGKVETVHAPGQRFTPLLTWDFSP